MSYQVLARKWRPRNFSTLVGQEHVVRALTHALTEQRLHHAYLFTGTRGVGKTTIARILAKSLNCETGIAALPCGQCSACQEIDAGRFIDLLEVDAATNTRVDEMRQLLENATYAPTRGRFKVYVIDEVHMLSTSAFNAMLKTLEEPPEHVKFILATTDPQKIPVTVLSRCLQFNLKQMPVPAIAGHLAHILQMEGIVSEPAALGLIARSAGGSMRDALSLLDQAIAHGVGQVDEAQVRSMLGSVDQDHLFTILEALHAADAGGLLQVASNLAQRGLSFAVALQELAALLTRIQVLQCVPTAADEDDPDRVRTQALAEALHPEFIQLAYQIVTVGRSELSLAPDEYAGFLMTLLRLHTFRPRSVGDIVAAYRPPPAAPQNSRAAAVPARPSMSAAPDTATRVGAASAVAPLAAQAPSPPTPPSISPPVTPPATVAVDEQPELAAPAQAAAAGQAPGGLAQDWPNLLTVLPISGLVRTLAAHCELRELSESQCRLCLPAEFSHLQMKPNPEKLQQALAAHFGRPLILTIEAGEALGETPAAAQGRQRQERQAQAETAIKNDDFVREVADLFAAKVVEASIKPID
ncbi:DNA polymerase III subunit gamma/tau [Azonexus sp.]|uniref:DNA polymerase III subunit gamma/tau n=1 Tax=Azonexus sp. TaxID=1872668 RepID=UPI0039E5CCEC